MSLRRTRANRAYQAKHRGGTACNYRTEMEDALIMLAWEAGELSEGQVARALALDRVSARVMKLEATRKGAEIGTRLWNEERAVKPRGRPPTPKAP